MGNTLDKPEESKTTERGACWAASTMQGWRPTNEDAHLCVESVAGLRDHQLYAIFDGHGGSFTARCAAERLLGVLERQPALACYAARARAAGGRPSDGATLALLETALQDAFLELDEEIRREAAKLASPIFSLSGVSAAPMTSGIFSMSNSGSSFSPM